MSSALLRQALALVDPEENIKKRKVSRGARRVTTRGQGLLINKSKIKKPIKEVSKSQDEVAEENIKKLLALSQATADSAVAKKITARAIKGKPLADKIEIKIEEEKSILFPEEETFKQFEKEHFCN